MARNFGSRRFGGSSAFVLGRSVRSTSPLRGPDGNPLTLDADVAARVRQLLGASVSAADDTNTDLPTLEHGTTQQQPAQAAESTTSSPPAVTPAQAAAAARIRVAADRKNGRKTADWIVELAHGA